jgi:hypothetical protein
MSDNPILQKYLRRNAGDGLTEGITEDAAEEPEAIAGCFGFLRGAREKAMCLELRKKNGHVLAINYSYISRFEYEPTTGIQLHTGGDIIKITGTNLNAVIGPQLRLFEAISRQKVPWISESDRTSRIEAGSDAVTVLAIEW